MGYFEIDSVSPSDKRSLVPSVQIAQGCKTDTIHVEKPRKREIDL